jgi:hypothetical protein
MDIANVIFSNCRKGTKISIIFRKISAKNYGQPMGNQRLLKMIKI